MSGDDLMSVGVGILRDQVAHWERLARTSAAELHSRLLLVQSLLQRLDTTDPKVLAVLRAAQGWSLEELSAAEAGPAPAEALVVRDGDQYVVMACPYCQGTHRHGAGGGLGGRQSHCRTAPRPYRLVLAGRQ